MDLYLVLGGRAGPRTDVIVGIEGEVARADQPGLVAAVDGGHGQPGGGVAFLFGSNIVDDESNSHAAFLVPGGGLVRGRGVTTCV